MMKSCNAIVSAAVARPRIVGVSFGDTKNNYQDHHNSDDLDPKLQNAAHCLRTPPVKRWFLHQSAHEAIAKNHADADEGDQRNRLQDQVQHDAML